MDGADISFWCQFIDRFEHWMQPESSFYFSHKPKALEEMLHKLREIAPEATNQHVMEVVIHLKIAYCREIKKLAENKQKSSNKYKPLWFFQYLKFLEKYDNKIIDSLLECDLDNSEMENNIPKCWSNQAERNSQPLDGPAWSSWEAQYRSLRPEQQFCARNCISEILHKASIGQLHATSDILLQYILSTDQNSTGRSQLRWSEFMDILGFCPGLWDQEYQSPSCAHTTAIGREKLLTKLREIEPKATTDQLTEVITHLRVLYRRELNKLANSKVSGSESNIYSPITDVYKPLWFFDKLSFLKNQESLDEIMPSIYDCVIMQNCTVEDITPNRSTTTNTESRVDNISNGLSNQQVMSLLPDGLTGLRAAWEAQYHSLNDWSKYYARKCIIQVLNKAALNELNIFSFFDVYRM